MIETLFGVVAIVVLLAGVLITQRLSQLTDAMRLLADQQAEALDDKHKHLRTELREGMDRQLDGLTRGFTEQGDRVRAGIGESGDRLRDSISQSFDRLRESIFAELSATRGEMDTLRRAHIESVQGLQIAISNTLNSLQMTQAQALGDNREAMIKQLADISLTLQEKQEKLRESILNTVAHLLKEQGDLHTTQMHGTLKRTAEQLTVAMGQLVKAVDSRLEQIYGKVNERLDEGFRKTNETFATVMTRLATIDEAQRKIDGLASNVINLNELLDDKRSRGVMGELQLEQLVGNVLPAGSFKLHAVLRNGVRADCLMQLPEPTGTVAVDASFAMDSYQKMFLTGSAESERAAAKLRFHQDVRNHIDRVADHMIVPDETSDGAVMFVPSEGVFAEIHAYHPDLVRHAMERKVWIVSPTTMMAVLNTARAVIKDVETREQVHIIKSAIGKLSDDFRRFDQRMRSLADHIRQAHEDAEQVQLSSERISKHFGEIEHVKLAPGKTPVPELVSN